MNNPTLYVKQSENIRKFTIDSFKKRFRFQNGSKKMLLDIGCGPGNVTHRVLYPLIEEGNGEIVGVDVSPEMIKYATATYGNQFLNFYNIDVARSAPIDFLDRFDYIFSFWTFHWISDQRKLYSNIFKMLKPTGEFFAIYIASSQIYDIYSTVWNKKRWVPYIKNFDNRIAPFQNSENPIEDLTDLLKSEGFRNVTCDLDLHRIEFLTPKEIEEFFIAITPECSLIPADQQKDFVDEQLQLLETKNTIDNNPKYSMSFNLFTVRGKKN